MGLELLFVFFLGASLGSFISAVEERFSRQGGKKNWGRILGLKGFARSYCDSCHRSLSWWENIPLVSFFLLQGHCRTCRSPLPSRYPLMEFLAGLVFVFLVFSSHCSPDLFARLRLLPGYLACVWFFVVYGLLAVGLLFVFLYDARHRIIPDRLVLALVVLALPLALAGGLENYLLAGLAAGAFLLFLHLITRGQGMGRGDVKLAFFMGLFLGWGRVWLAFYLAFLLGGLFGLGLILAKRKKMKDKIAFGPFLVLAVFASWFWGEAILTGLEKMF